MPDPKVKYNRTRIAPTPSGFLHIGNVLSFAITAALAKQSGAKILLRIDDIDQARADKQYVQNIFDTLNFLEIPWDEGPRDAKEFDVEYSQLHRMGLYNEALKYLQDKKLVFACNCSRKQLSESPCSCYEKQLSLTADNVSWRLITSPNDRLAIKDYNGELIQAILPTEMNNFVVRKKDGFPAYQLTSVIDDLYYGADLVVRGQDLWHSSLAQYQLAIALGRDDFNNITFYHHPLIKDTAGNKLSKSTGATSIKYLREQGKSASDIYQLIAAITGINEPVYNWEQLVSIMINKH
ncbi:glutamate--tRNA ligase family protein [Mucilaginibacter sp. L196]|uniref:glutamate--tRNA ligase family protein n=1 Tax=Mucilaginibacter sp. L196 TaxID=1641870 RepID=UPI00131C66B6|nr:glutamate--tRNA ligase family protein [Mucilaginibacter sp. L196]